MKICPNCGKQLSDNMVFCVNCGSKVTDAVTSQNQAQVSTGSQPQNNYQQQNDYQQQSNYQQQNDYQQSSYQQQNDYQQNNNSSVFSQIFSNRNNADSKYKVAICARNIYLCILLCTISCSVYKMYWQFCVINDLNTASPDSKDKGAGMVLLLNILTCGIYKFIWAYKAGEKIEKIKQLNGEVPSNSSLLFLFLCLIPGIGDVVTYCLIQDELNKVAMYN